MTVVAHLSLKILRSGVCDFFAWRTVNTGWCGRRITRCLTVDRGLSCCANSSTYMTRAQRGRSWCSNSPVRLETTFVG